MLTNESVEERIEELQKEINRIEWHVSSMRKKGIRTNKEDILKEYRKELSGLYRNRIKSVFR